jgi:hypothetical protein
LTKKRMPPHLVFNHSLTPSLIWGNMTTRKNAGASLALVAVCAGALIVFIVICFQFIMVFGGMQELNSTADAAALNVAQRAMRIRTPADAVYSDCADSQGAIGLANINRVWGKSYLINANVEQMIANQQSTDQATSAADQAFGSAQVINDRLCSGLKDELTLGNFFDQIAGARLHRMLGNKQVSSDTNAQWNTALAYRGDQSNLAAKFTQVPSPSNSHLSVVAAGNNSTYLPGYMPIQANGKEFYFVTFHNAERTHLITESYFQHSRPEAAALAFINNPLPNAFSGHGTTENSLNAQSFAVANPQVQYNLAIPHAYATISLVNLAFWIVQNKQVNITHYGFAPEKQLGANQIHLRNPLTNLITNDYLDGYASLGNEFQGNTSLLQAVTSIQPDVLANLAQRIQEVKPDFTLSDLEQLLQQQMIVPDVKTYFIYPSYTTPDDTDPTIKVTPLNAQGIKTLPKWLAMAAANEGQTKTIATETPVQDDPNYDWELVFGSHFQAGPHWTEVGGNVNWTPGTGFSQTLGRLTAVHTTRCFFDVNPTN